MAVGPWRESLAALKKYPDELRERAVRLYRESEPRLVIRWLAGTGGEHASDGIGLGG